jgi:hypothetical protein
MHAFQIVFRETDCDAIVRTEEIVTRNKFRRRFSNP